MKSPRSVPRREKMRRYLVTIATRGTWAQLQEAYQVGEVVTYGLIENDDLEVVIKDIREESRKPAPRGRRRLR